MKCSICMLVNFVWIQSAHLGEKITSSSRLNLGKKLPHHHRKANWLHAGAMLLHISIPICEQILLLGKQFFAVLFISYLTLWPLTAPLFGFVSPLIYGRLPLHSGCHLPPEGMLSHEALLLGYMEFADIF